MENSKVTSIGVVAVVIAAILAGGIWLGLSSLGASVGTSVEDSLSGASAEISASVAQAIAQAGEGLGGNRGGSQVFADGAQLGDLVTELHTGRIEAADNQEFWVNKTSKNVYVDLSEMAPTVIGAAASSSFDFFIGTTTASSVLSDYTDPYSGLVDDLNVATSAVIRVINNIKDGGTDGNGIATVAPGERVFFMFQQTDSPCGTGACETATSTNRGFNIDWSLRIHYKP